MYFWVWCIHGLCRHAYNGTEHDAASSVSSFYILRLSALHCTVRSAVRSLRVISVLAACSCLLYSIYTFGACGGKRNDMIMLFYKIQFSSYQYRDTRILQVLLIISWLTMDIYLIISLVNYSYILLVMLGHDPKVLCTYGWGRNCLPFLHRINTRSSYNYCNYTN